jgi:uncharacterized membrane protein
MKKNILAFVTCAISILLLDGLWLGVVATDLYRNGIGPLMRDKPDLGAAAAFYLLYTAGTLVFAIRPALAAKSALRALQSGALFGFFCYMTYELTNLATLRGWPLNVVLADMAWGTVLTAASGVAGYAAASRLRA